MHFFNRLGVIIAVAGVLGSMAVSLDAHTKKGDKFLKQGRKAQLAKDWDTALDFYEKALDEDPSDIAYRMVVRRTRFQVGQMHLTKGRELRRQGKLDAALAEFQKSYTVDPSSSVAEQELRRTYQMIKRREEEKKRGKSKAKGETGETIGLTPAERAWREAQKRIASIEPVPTLKPITPRLNALKINNQSTRVLYETVCKLAGINVIFDPEFQPPPKKQSLDLSNTTLEDALRYLSILTKTFWKPLSENTIFVTNDNVTKRRDYQEMVVQVFYLKNVTKVQQLQEIATAVRSLTDIRRTFTYNEQNAILVRGTQDQVALAEKLIHDLDKPRAEVVVNVIVMEVNRNRTRNLAASIMSGTKAGLKLPLSFSLGNSVSVPTTSTGTGTGTTTSTTSSSGTNINLGQLGKLRPEDWKISLPNALLQALMSDSTTRILQEPQLRAADGQKASLKLGDRYPYATGSFQPGVGAVGVSPLVSTQFQFADVGVNVDLTPKIHGDNEISMHIEIDISAINGTVNLGGLSQPIIGQRKITEDIRVRNGQVTLLGGLTQHSKTKSNAGVPILSDIPIIKWFGFTNRSSERKQGDLLIALIPHIVREPEISAENLRGVAAGSDQVVRLRYAPPPVEQKPAPPPIGAGTPVAPPLPSGKPGPVPSTPATGKPAPAAPQPIPPTPPAVKPATAAPHPPPAPGGVATLLRFNPPAVQAKTGRTFSVALVLENGTDIFNAPMRFHFDPKVLRLKQVSRGTLLAGDGKQVIFTRNIFNSTGNASIVLNRLPGSGGVSGTGTLVTLTFEAIHPGTTRVTIPALTIRNSEMQPAPVTAPSLRVTVE